MLLSALLLHDICINYHDLHASRNQQTLLSHRLSWKQAIMKWRANLLHKSPPSLLRYEMQQLIAFHIAKTYEKSRRVLFENLKGRVVSG